MLQTVPRVLKRSNIERQGVDDQGNTFCIHITIRHFKLFSLIHFYMWEYFACMCDSILHAGSTNGGQKRISGSPGTGVRDSSELCGCQELNPRPLEE